MCEIALSTGDVVFVSAEDFARVSSRNWCLWTNTSGRKYAISNTTNSDGRHTTQSMHRFILELPPRYPHVDHENGNGLDNRRSNIRVANRRENGRNHRKAITEIPPTSRFIGVRNDHGVGWAAGIQIDDGFTVIGTYQSEEDAAIARDRAAIYHHLDFARLNFPDRGLVGSSIEDLRKEVLSAKASVFRGCYQDRHGRWVAHIRIGGNRIPLGRFFTMEEASDRYHEYRATAVEEGRVTVARGKSVSR